jgi:hypothetical protein
VASSSLGMLYGSRGALGPSWGRAWQHREVPSPVRAYPCLFGEPQRTGACTGDEGAVRVQGRPDGDPCSVCASWQTPFTMRKEGLFCRPRCGIAPTRIARPMASSSSSKAPSASDNAMRMVVAAALVTLGATVCRWKLRRVYSVDTDDAAAMEVSSVTATPCEALPSSSTPEVQSHTPAALTTSVEPVASASPASINCADELAARVAELLAELRPTLAGSEERRECVVELLTTLQTGSALGTAREQRAVARAFVDHAGPEVVYEMESSMNGNWIADAKNGTMQKLSDITRLPGPIGKAMTNYRLLAEKNKLDAAELRCMHHLRAQSTTRAQ